MDKTLSGRALYWAKKLKAVQLLGGKCSCGIVNPLVLDFHHNSQNKEHMISRLRAYRWTNIEKELSKCVLLCSNCHSKFHFSESKNCDNRKRLLKVKLLELKGQSKCIKCGYDVPCSLDFHHPNEKKFEISSYIFDKLDIPWEEVILEIEKCSVLCKNCHRIEHYAESFYNLLPIVERKIKEYKERPAAYDKNEIYSKYDSGMAQIEIARSLGCAKSTISMIIRDRKKDVENKV